MKDDKEYTVIYKSNKEAGYSNIILLSIALVIIAIIIYLVIKI